MHMESWFLCSLLFQVAVLSAQIGTGGEHGNERGDSPQKWTI